MPDDLSIVDLMPDEALSAGNLRRATMQSIARCYERGEITPDDPRTPRLLENLQRIRHDNTIGLRVRYRARMTVKAIEAAKEREKDYAQD